jgi:predicted component of viral defense system (DUF524 family)
MAPGDVLEFRNEAGVAVAVLRVSPESADTGPLVLTPVEADDRSEARFQVLEGAAYEYELDTPGLRLAEISGVVVRSRLTSSHDRGRFTPGLNTGRLKLCVVRAGEPAATGWAHVEVRSRKLNYNSEYRFMLEDIAGRCTDLLLELASPAEHSLRSLDNQSAETICQRFAFARALLGSRRFSDAVHRITAMPHRRWELQPRIAPLSRGVKPTAGMARQVASATRRIRLPNGHPLAIRCETVPEYVTVSVNEESLDTPENRFVKHALRSFLTFVTSVREKLERVRRQSDARIVEESRSLEEQLSSELNRGFFREISEPTQLPLGSPVLQRKGGYREVLAAWLQFDMAARLCWSGGEDVYGAGKRDVALLYEYWVFFKLLDIMAGVFKLNQPSAKSLIEQTSDGFGLRLRTGVHTTLDGVYDEGSRRLRVVLSYNRTFLRDAEDAERSYPSAGSWTERMRPDYTLSLWPAEFSEPEAERQELVTHVHFDAKYRVKDLSEALGSTDESFEDVSALERDVSAEKAAQREGKYLRADLLKMHAYKDAIRRTAGAYVLYPGTENRRWRGFHEIIPGLGAFGIRPSGDEDDGSRDVEAFVREVVRHVCDQATQRERDSYHRFVVHDSQPGPGFVAGAPEKGPQGDLRAPPPAETYVIVGWFTGDPHLAWIRRSGKFNLRAGIRPGSLRLGPEIAGARYLLLHGPGKRVEQGLYEITSDGPLVYSAADLQRLGCPAATGSELYLVFDVSPSAAFADVRWDASRLLGTLVGQQSAKPFARSLTDLLENGRAQGE